MKLSQELTTVTPLSKFIALILFITLPILAFIYGTQVCRMYQPPSPAPTATPPVSPSQDEWHSVSADSYLVVYPRSFTYTQTRAGATLDNGLDVTYTTMQPARKTVKNMLVRIEKKQGSIESLTQQTSVEGEKIFGTNTVTYAYSGVEGTGIAQYFLPKTPTDWIVFTHYVYYDNDIDASDRTNPDYLDTQQQEQIMTEILTRFRLR